MSGTPQQNFLNAILDNNLRMAAALSQLSAMQGNPGAAPAPVQSFAPTPALTSGAPGPAALMLTASGQFAQTSPLSLVPANHQAPPQEIPFSDRLATLADLEKLRADQNVVNQRIHETAQGLGRNQRIIAKATGVQKLAFKVPNPRNLYQVASFQSKAAIEEPPYVPLTEAGKAAYALGMEKNQGKDMQKAIAEAMAMEADEDEAAANFVIVDKTIIERKQMWTQVNDARVLGMNCPELQQKIRDNIPAGGNIKFLQNGKLNAAGVKAIQDAREYWGFLELFDKPFDFAAGKAEYEKVMAEHGFPSHKGWDGNVDWTLHRDK